MIRAPNFWWRARPSLLAHILSPFGALWGWIAQRRMERRGQSASVPVICIGNPVAGGAGKTPAAIEIARLLALSGRKPVFLSRGYGGSLPGPVQVDIARHIAREVGDEPLLLARIAPCVVARDRVAGSRLAADLGDVIVMDDGFQNPSLHKDLPILVVDGAMGAGNGLCIPAGPLRAPLNMQFARAKALIVIGEGAAGEKLTRHQSFPLFRARLVPDTNVSVDLKGRRVLAFAGIGRPQKFADTLKEIGADVVELRAFADHHAFTAHDASKLIADAKARGLILVTTEKDGVRLTGPALKELAENVRTVPVRLAFDDTEAVAALLTRLFV
jgi:tetraacyldisaccharide 4'-kinase